MAAFEIGAELHLVDGDKGDVEVARHRLDGGDPEARIAWLDLLSPVMSATFSAPTRSTHLL